MPEKLTALTVEDLAGRIGARFVGDPGVTILRVNTLVAAGPEDITFAESNSHIERLYASNCAAALVPHEIEGFEKPQLIVENIQNALIQSLEIFAPRLEVTPGIAPSAEVHPEAQVADSVCVGPNAVIGPRVKIGENCVIGPSVTVLQDVTIGSHTRIDAGVVIYHGVTIGKYCVIQANSTIGSTGFGYRFVDGQHRLIPHNGSVIIEDAVEIGANCAIDRAKFGNTIVGAGTKFDNLVHIAHNVTIGKCCLFVAQVGVAGSVTIGNGVVFAGQAGIVDHLNIGDGAIIGAKAGVTQDLAPGMKVFGAPARERTLNARVFIASGQLPDALKRLKKLEKKVQQLETAKDNKK